MQQEPLGPDLDILLFAGNTPCDDGYLPPPDDRHNISASGHKGPRPQAQPFVAEYETRQFPPNTPKESPFVPRADAGPAPAPVDPAPQHPPAFYGSPQPPSYYQSPYGYPPINQYVPQPAPARLPQQPVPQGQYVTYPNPAFGVPQHILHQPPVQQGPYTQPQFLQPPLQGNVLVAEHATPPNADLAGDPNYFCVRAQMEGGGTGNDTRTTCFTSLCINLGKVSYKAAKLCLSPLIPQRNGVPSDSHYMQQAFVTGWAMLTSFVFPLVPSHYLRCLWVLAQFLFAIAASSMICAAFPIFIITIFPAFFCIVLAILDLICCLVVLAKQCLGNRTANSEAQPLIPRQYRDSGITLWFSKYNDILRLAITEMILYGVLVFILPVNAQELHNQPINIVYYTHVRFALFIIMVVGFVLFVYIVQFLALARMFAIKFQLTLHSPARRKTFLLFHHLILQYVGQRTIQVVMLITSVHLQVSSHSTEFDSSYLDIVFIAYLTPVITLLTSFVLYYGWIEDACTVRCMDYLQGLDKIGSNPQTSRATKEEINRILAFYDYQNTSGEVSRFSQRNFSRNYLYPLQSPLTMLLCLPSLACLVAYFARLFADTSALWWVIPQVVGFVLLDAHLIFVLLCLLIFLPVSLFALVYRIACKPQQN